MNTPWSMLCDLLAVIQPGSPMRSICESLRDRRGAWDDKERVAVIRCWRMFRGLDADAWALVVPD